MTPIHYQGVKTNLQDALLKWYASNRRELPWRYTPDPYAVLISEVMLQQTQVSRAVPKYLEFLNSFPTVQALSASPLSSVIKIWRGLGYNSRAVRLHKAAQIITNRYNGNIPSEISDLKTLPGIGSYTASAIACFAFGTPVAAFDTNIYRVISRLVFGLDPPHRTEIENVARDLLPQNAPGNWQQGLMDLGATVCTIKNPNCSECPIYSYCNAGEKLQGIEKESLSKFSVPYFPKQSKFKGSTRYYRGKVIAALIDLPDGKSISLTKLKLIIPIEIGSGAHVGGIEKILTGLIKDGLVSEGEKIKNQIYYRLP